MNMCPEQERYSGTLLSQDDLDDILNASHGIDNDIIDANSLDNRLFVLLREAKEDLATFKANRDAGLKTMIELINELDKAKDFLKSKEIITTDVVTKLYETKILVLTRTNKTLDLADIEDIGHSLYNYYQKAYPHHLSYTMTLIKALKLTMDKVTMINDDDKVIDYPKIVPMPNLFEAYTDKTSKYRSKIDGLTGYVYKYALPGMINIVAYSPSAPTTDKDVISGISLELSYPSTASSVKLPLDRKLAINLVDYAIILVKEEKKIQTELEKIIDGYNDALNILESSYPSIIAKLSNHDRVFKQMSVHLAYIASLIKAIKSLVLSKDLSYFVYILKVIEAIIKYAYNQNDPLLNK